MSGDILDRLRRFYTHGWSDRADPHTLVQESTVVYQTLGDAIAAIEQLREQARIRTWAERLAADSVLAGEIETTGLSALEAACRERDSLRAAIEQLQPWKDAVIDAGVVNWTLSEENADNPRKAIEDLIQCIVRETLDPAVSKPAHDLHAAIEQRDERLSLVREAVMDTALTDLACRTAIELLTRDKL